MSQKTAFAGVSENRNGISAVALVVAGVVILALAGGAVWAFTPIPVTAEAQQQREFQVDCQYPKFRQIMVRKNATRAIVENGGMQLKSEQLGDVQLDLSADDRPILNAIRGKSRAEVAASKVLVVQLTNPYVKADQLKLKQLADVKNQGMTVTTESIQAAGNLKTYQTKLQASPQDDESTKVQLQVSMEVTVEVPRLFAGRAESQVQSAAQDGLQEQEEAIRALVKEFSDQRLILPELGDKDPS